VEVGLLGRPSLFLGTPETFLPSIAFLLADKRGVCMRPVFALLASLTLLVPQSLPQTRLTVNDLQNHPFAADCPSGQTLRLELRSGEFHIVGRDDNKISVRLGGRNADKAQDLTVSLKHSGNHADLRVWGGPKSELQVTIEIPKTSSLFVRMPFGDLTLEGISGDKDVELHAGDLSIAVGDAADYAHVDASVLSGAIEADPFGESHGGLFRSFEKSGNGKFKLHAHLGAGDLTLR
jgi:hypothetical protein